MSKITVERQSGDTFEVTIEDAAGKSRHSVTMSAESYERLGGGRVDEEHVLDAAFRFLLEREPKEHILQRFDVMVIGRYFPEFERALPSYFRKAP